MAQIEMFTSDTLSEAGAPDPDRVRLKLQAMLVEVRKAGVVSLPERRLQLMKTVVPQMIRWLPDDEAERVERAFGEVLAT